MGTCHLTFEFSESYGQSSPQALQSERSGLSSWLLPHQFLGDLGASSSVKWIPPILASQVNTWIK